MLPRKCFHQFSVQQYERMGLKEYLSQNRMGLKTIHKLWFICILCVSERLIRNKCLHLERVLKAISGMCMCVCVWVCWTKSSGKPRDLTLPDLKWHQTFTPGWASPSLRLGDVDILRFRTWVWTSEVDLLLKRVFFLPFNFFACSLIHANKLPVMG